MNSTGDGGNKAQSSCSARILPLPWQGLFQVLSPPVCSQPGWGWAEGRPCWLLGWSFISSLEDSQCCSPTSKPQGQCLRDKPRGPFAFHSFITGYFPRLLPKVNWQLYQMKPLPSPAFMFFPNRSVLKKPCALSPQCLGSPFSFLNPQHSTFGKCCDTPLPSDANPSARLCPLLATKELELRDTCPTQLFGRVCPSAHCRAAAGRCGTGGSLTAGTSQASTAAPGPRGRQRAG